MSLRVFSFENKKFIHLVVSRSYVAKLLFLVLRFTFLPYVSAFHVKNCVQNHALLTVSAVLFLSGLID